MAKLRLAVSAARSAVSSSFIALIRLSMSNDNVAAVIGLVQTGQADAVLFLLKNVLASRSTFMSSAL